MAIITAVQAAGFLRDVGFHGPALVKWTAFGRGESDFNTRARSGANARGVWQVHVPSHPKYDPERLYDPAYNAQAAWEISKGGTDERPWDVSRPSSTRYWRQYEAEAVAAVAALGAPGVTVSGTVDLGSDHTTLGPAPTASPPPQTSPALLPKVDTGDLTGLVMANDTARAAIRDHLEAATFDWGMAGAGVVRLTIRDTDRQLRTPGTLTDDTSIQIGDRRFVLVRARKRGSSVQLEFEDWIVAALRRRSGPVSAAAGTTTRAEFVGRLAADAGVPAMIHAGDPTRDLIGRGLQDPAEDSWSAINRLARETNERAFSDGLRLLYGPDEWLASRPPLSIAEHTDGVGSIDWTVDVALAEATATVEVDAERWALLAGQPVIVLGEGLGSGDWLVGGIRGRLLRSRITIDLRRQQQPLPEPEPAPVHALGAGPIGGIAIGSGAPGPPDWAGARQVVQSITAAGMTRGLTVTSAKRPTKNTSSGGVSDHWTGKTDAYAEDISNVARGSQPSPQMDDTAVAIAAMFGRPYTRGTRLEFTVNHGGFRIQVLFRTMTGGNHFDHLHIGARRV